MGRISKLQSEIRHLQEKLAERNKTIAGNNQATSKLREEHSKEVVQLKANLAAFSAPPQDAVGAL